jgi:hypothetical protein
MTLPLTTLVEIAYGTCTEDDIALAIREVGWYLKQKRINNDVATKLVEALDKLRTAEDEVL